MLHSLLHEFLAERLGAELAATHSALVDGYRRRSPDGWAGVPDDGYFGDRVAFHLVEAGRIREGELLDRPWMEARFRRATSHVPFLADLRVGCRSRGVSRSPPPRSSDARHLHDRLGIRGERSAEPASRARGAWRHRHRPQRAATMSGATARPQAYIDIAELLINRNRIGEALVAAERAMAVANDEVEGSRGIEMLAKAATCLGRCGRDTSETLARARTLAVERGSKRSRPAPTHWRR